MNIITSFSFCILKTHGNYYGNIQKNVLHLHVLFFLCFLLLAFIFFFTFSFSFFHSCVLVEINLRCYEEYYICHELNVLFSYHLNGNIVMNIM